ncbi:MarR family winged helix-turn-helix transcriptional regulator [Pseudovibrio exalbescens]|uniref:MarR family winged helix-turn-helix transcriptional regulator n=1 Tax=Pseudovibrio exalbescens TaxID=197461 RepID=UPI000C9C0D69|nr:MarR family transcriptional regulator [Pseudovibrio exalbescens]
MKNDSFTQLMENIYAAGDKMDSYAAVPREYGTDDLLYMTEVHLLDRIGNTDRANITQLANEIGKTKGAIAQTVDKLEAKGLLRKEPDPTDVRRKILLLTDTGKTVFEAHRAKDQKAFERFKERLPEYTEEDFQKCADIIAKIFKL